MRLCLYCLLLILVFAGSATGQNRQISGFVKDAGSKEPLIEAGVAEISSRRGVWTNPAGYFSLQATVQDSIRLRVSYSGYETLSLALSPKQDTLLSIFLFPRQLDTVEIRAEMASRPGRLSAVDIPIAHIENMPMLLGEVDVLKAFQLMPGVQGGTEGTAGLYVRGGSPDQNLILLDDVPLYYVNHLGGFISLFDAEAIGFARLYKGSFPARYGGRLSAVLDLRIKEGNKETWQKQFSLGVLSSRFLLEGPVKKDTSSLLISGRYSTLGPISWALVKLAATEGNVSGYYTFYDLYLKHSHAASLKDKFFTSVYAGRDGLHTAVRSRFTTDLQDERSVSAATLGWGNQLLAFRWQHVYHPKLLHSLTLAYTRFNYETKALTRRYDERNGGILLGRSLFQSNSGIQDWTAKIDFDVYPAAGWQVKFGAAITRHRFRPGTALLEETGEGLPANTAKIGALIPALEESVYGEWERRFGTRFFANMGLHGAAYQVRGRGYATLQPRLLIGYDASDRLGIQISWSSMQQYLHLLTRSNIGLPSDLWVPATDSIGPQRAEQVVLGLNYVWPTGLHVQIEGFYKTFRRLIAYQEGSTAGGSLINGWEQQVAQGGRGWVRGIEILIQQKTGKSTGWVAYTLSWNDRQFAGLNQGNRYPDTYDHRHAVSVSWNHQFDKKFAISLIWQFRTGRPLTLALANYPALDFPRNPDEPAFPDAEYYDSKNAFRMPAYHRMDISFQWRKEMKKGEKRTSIGFYNLYNRQNPFFYFYYQPNAQAAVEFSQFTLFPILPSLSYTRVF